MTKKIRFFLIIGVLFYTTGCYLYPIKDIYYVYDKKVNYASLRTFDWLPVPTKARMETRESMLIINQIKGAVNRELEAKGLKVNSSNPDFLIAFLHGGKEKKVSYIDWGYKSTLGGGESGPFSFLWRRHIQRIEYEEGSFILDFVDPHTKEVIWRVATTHEIIPYATSKKKAEQINRIVPKMLNEFPP
jgi:hypothetical protein